MQAYKTHQKQLFHKLFGGIDDGTLEEIFTIGRQLELKAGDYLFHQGARENVLYIVLSGRLRALIEAEGEFRILGDIGEGEPVGEFALFTNEPRMASVLAIRKSVVLEFNQQEYQTLVGKNPALATALTNFVIQRLRRNTFQQNKSTPPKNIAIINLQPENDLSPWTKDMEKYFSDKKTSIQIYDNDSVDHSKDQELFGSLEQHEGLNILVCDHQNKIWSHQCLVYADLVIVATDFNADPSLYQIEKELDLYTQNILNKKLYLLLLHQEDVKMPENTAKWLQNREVNLHIHIRQNNQADVRRFCRIITNQAVGIVLGGGGAKGYAHLGVVRALLEEGIEIDFLGGTSAGAIYGISMSYVNFEFNKIQELSEDSVKRKLTSNDFALPMLSIMTGRKVKKFLKDTYGESHLEDLWINSYCVSTNFSKASAKIHTNGLLWKQVMASMAIPGIFPPVVIDKYLHVDGAVMDNLPIEPMYQYPVGNIIAVSLSGLSDRQVDFPESPASWTLFWDKITGKRKFRLPGIASIMINSLTLNSLQKQEVTKSKVSHYFELNLKGFGFMDDKKWKQIQEKGYQQTMEYLENLQEEDRFWL